MKRKLYSNVIKDKKAIEEKKKEVEKAKREYQLDNEKEVIIVKENNGTRLLKLISYKFEGLMRITSWVLLMILVSIGSTVIFNPNLREQFINIFK